MPLAVRAYRGQMYVFFCSLPKNIPYYFPKCRFNSSFIQQRAGCGKPSSKAAAPPSATPERRRFLNAMTWERPAGDSGKTGKRIRHKLYVNHTQTVHRLCTKCLQATNTPYMAYVQFWFSLNSNGIHPIPIRHPARKPSASHLFQSVKLSYFHFHSRLIRK
jgi:hypothetical protein